METCLFCKIFKGEIPCHNVWEDENHIAFLDIMPIKEGHVLVIPKKHLPYAFEMSDDELDKLMHACKKVAEGLKKAFKPKTGKVGSVIYGLDVDHAHVHLVPLDKSGDLNFASKKSVPKDQLGNIADKIKAVF